MDASKREIDAVPVAIAREESNNDEERYAMAEKSVNCSAVRTVQNNLTYENVNNSSINYNINNSKGIHLGSVFNIGLNVGQVVKSNDLSLVQRPQKSAVSTQLSTSGALQLASQASQEDESGYKKTPTIAAMMTSKDRLYDGYLDYICGKFGHRWRDLTFFLGIDQLFVERMKEDYFTKGGTKEVVYQCISHYFRENDSKKVEGWFIKFLWKNKFKSTVWAVKDKYKEFKALEKELDLYIENNESA